MASLPPAALGPAQPLFFLLTRVVALVITPVLAVVQKSLRDVEAGL